MFRIKWWISKRMKNKGWQKNEYSYTFFFRHPSCSCSKCLYWCWFRWKKKKKHFIFHFWEPGSWLGLTIIVRTDLLVFWDKFYINNGVSWDWDQSQGQARVKFLRTSQPLNVLIEFLACESLYCWHNTTVHTNGLIGMFTNFLHIIILQGEVSSAKFYFAEFSNVMLWGQS